MEYCSGGDLLDRLAHVGYFDERECALLMK